MLFGHHEPTNISTKNTVVGFQFTYSVCPTIMTLQYVQFFIVTFQFHEIYEGEGSKCSNNDTLNKCLLKCQSEFVIEQCGCKEMYQADPKGKFTPSKLLSICLLKPRLLPSHLLPKHQSLKVKQFTLSNLSILHVYIKCCIYCMSIDSFQERPFPYVHHWR